MSRHILPHALRTPAIKKLEGKRIVLASNSPRRKEILNTFGLAPDIVPSTFEENLSSSSFSDVHEYPVATASHKVAEVYERLVREDPDNAPDLVIAADTIVLTHALPSTSQTSYTVLPQINQELLEKPLNRSDNLRMLMDMNGGVCEVVTGVCVGQLPSSYLSTSESNIYMFSHVAYPVIYSPGYTIKSIDERTLVYFADNPEYLIQAYVDSGEGVDRAGGFAIQVVLPL
ncbi:hypothetical protein Ac2012v2_007826 [Leucoagaricus gongylophorus]